LIDWCLTPTLAVFKVHRGVVQGLNSQLNTFIYHDRLNVLIFHGFGQ